MTVKANHLKKVTFEHAFSPKTISDVQTTKPTSQKLTAYQPHNNNNKLTQKQGHENMKIESTWRKVRRVCEANEGRDKSMKILQYAIRLATHTSRNYDDTIFSNISATNLELLDALASRLSHTRVVIRLLKFFQKIDVLKDHKFSPVKALQTGKVGDVVQCVDFVNASIGLGVDFLNDVHFWSAMKFIPEHLHKKIDSFLSQIWFITVVIDTMISLIRLSEISKKIRETERTLTIHTDFMDNMDLTSIKNGAYEQKLKEKHALQKELRVLKHKRLALIIGTVKFFGDLGVAVILAFKVPKRNGLKLSSGLVSGVASLVGMLRKNVV